MTIRLSDCARDRFIGPGVSAFNTADIPIADSIEQADYWLQNYALNSMLRGSFGPPMNAYAHTFLRRVQGAFIEHEAARDSTLRFLASGGQSVSLYTAALMHWEYFLTQSWQGYATGMRLLELVSGKRAALFVKGDGSIEQRLNALYNSMKHAEKRIAAGQIAEGAITPVWLTNDGMESTDTRLTYAETAAILTDLAEWAEVFVDPRETANKAQARATKDDDGGGTDDERADPS